MDLRDSAEEAAFRAGLRDWLARSVPVTTGTAGAPARGRWDDVDAVRSFSAALHEAGYAGLTWPVEYGGRGLSPVHQAIYLEESARAEAGEHIGVIGLGMVGPTVIACGSPAQRAWYLPRILTGEIIFCQGFSEPEAGSDLSAVRTLARRDGDELVVTGRKVWSSYAHLADHCLLLARTDPDATRHRGLSCLLVDLRTPGVTVRPIRQMTGEAEFAEIEFDEVRVPLDAVVGEIGDGWRVAMTTLAHERGTFGFTLTARLEVAFRRLVATARARGRDTDPLVRDQIAARYVELEGLRWTNRRALAELRRTGTPGPETSVVKLRWSQAHQRLTALAVLLTADGRPDGWDRYWRREMLRSRANTIEGGTSQVLRNVIAERVLGLPRSY
ncbi:acyl-CoA dehydrogenase family protein [Micromonospora robiginosa]|uniref:Acyl-CoA dehydrogenase family protein n=1 Tax=Micromonospora robiginosa TaxID=2749844 RepID=A0A7L6B1Q1_9ACTN|nr:acyl-CoA dehydrogenase family protein [Micromonospora ferruginea]QLQ35857.1 acyl-CoA dehydrogenase family protein [Micromonospora ferruginea]